MERLDFGLDCFYGNSHLLGHFFLTGLVVRQELVQRRVQSANGNRQPIHGLEEADEISSLKRQ